MLIEDQVSNERLVGLVLHDAEELAVVETVIRDTEEEQAATSLINSVVRLVILSLHGLQETL